MTPEHWQKIKPILEAALEINPDKRHLFLESICDDGAMLCEIESLLNFEGRKADRFEQSAYDIVTENGDFEAPKSHIGTQIGRYRVISELGAGGMGTVFLAERADGEFEQKVALKLIKSGLGSDSILRRFVSERQILASLDHPNIAHLIDGGTSDDSLAYFVMEYVEGETIVDFARNRSLILSERLDLFRKVCAGVLYAHQNLVIHRDLKPSNILVNSSGVPKLLDFGIAKLLKADNTNETATQHFAFTPEYASPEQIRGENLTTATDIYSLGVILYELLTGIRPFSFDGKNFGQIIQTSSQTEPLKPSSAVKRRLGTGLGKPEDEPNISRLKIQSSKSLLGDLDNIVLKALKREPERRYSSVEQFSEDIRRYLKGLPVLARQDTWRYRTDKFVRRNSLVVAAVCLAALILISGIVATTIQARRANIEREKAERRFNDVRTLANSFIFEVNEKIGESPIKARELLVTRAVEYLDKLVAEAGDNPDLQAELAAGYEKIGDVQAEYFGSGTGDTAGALGNHRKALTIRQKLSADDPANVKHVLNLASSQLKIADLSVTEGNTPTALENYDYAVATIEAAQHLDPNDQNVKRELARAYAKLGQGILRTGSISRSLQNYQKAAAIMRDLAAGDPTNPKLQHSVSVYESYIGYAKIEMGRVDEALGHFSEALRIDEIIWRADMTNLESRRNLSIAEQWTGFALRHLRRFDEARAHLQTALDIQQQLYENDRSNTGDVNSLADCNLEIGWTISESGDPKASVKYLEKAIALYENVAETDGNNLSALRQISFTRTRLGDAVAKAGNGALAAQFYAKALREIDAIILRDEKNTEFRNDKAICLLRLAEQGSNTVANLEDAIVILEKLTAESPEHRQRQNDLQTAKMLLAKSGAAVAAGQPPGPYALFSSSAILTQ